MNLTEQMAATKRLQEVWQFLFADQYPIAPAPRQFKVWLSMYGEKATEEGFNRANIWLNKASRHRSISFDDLIRYASACARNLKEESEKVVRNG